MSCSDLAQLERFVKRELDAASSESIKDHLSSCAACREQVATLRENLAFGEEIKAVADMTRTRDPAVPGTPVEGRGGRTPALPHDSFPGYKLVREIHRGGQGVVYQAIQKSTKRKVAIKVMKEGPFAGSAEKARFEREIQILGQLKHPHIITIYDSGTAAGQHYFVMDYISGQPLDVYMAGRVHSIEETLDLFAKICDAINAAHLRGVIHRDLKPGNIRIDEAGEPHVLDFGLAKVAGGDSDASMMTMTGQFIGSLPWASPEQAEAAPGKIDVRTDVYSLGVLLYQMLTGKFPYDVAGSMRDVLDNILKAAPTKPSTIRKQINDEIEAIVLKCLSKERERRYQTAGELARDIRRSLTGEPIEAKRDSTLYILRKQLRRYRTPVTIAALLVVLLLGFGIVMAIHAKRYARLAQSEKNAKEEALAATNEAQEQGRRADQQRDAAVAAQRVAEQRRQEAEWRAYLANIATADAALGINDAASCQRHLNEAGQTFRDWEWRHLNSRTDLSVATLEGHGISVVAVAYSPDGRRIASGSWATTIKLWDAATGEELATLRGHTDSVTSVAFSPDSRRLVSGSEDNTVRIWEAATHELVHTLRGHQRRVRCVAFRSDGARIISGADDESAKVWDAWTGGVLHTLQHGGQVNSVTFSPDGGQLASASRDGTIRLWDAVTGKTMLTIRTDLLLSAVAYSPDGTRLAGAGASKIVRLWDPATGQELASLRTDGGPIDSLAFAPGGRWIAGGSGDKTVRLWDVNTREQLITLRGHTQRVTSVSFSPDSKRIVSAALDNTLRIWEPFAREEILTLRGHQDVISSVALSPDGRRIVSGCRDQTVKLWDLHSGVEVATLRGHTARVHSVAFSPDGTRIASGSRDTTVRIWDATTGEELNTLHGHTAGVLGVAFSSDGKWLASASGDATVRLWNAVTGECQDTLKGHTGPVLSVRFNPDSTQIASGAREIRVWDVLEARQVRMMRGHTRKVRSIVYSPDGARIASSADDDTVRLWDVTTGEELLVVACTGNTAVAFNPTGSRLAVGAGDGIRLLDSKTAHEVMSLRGVTDKVFSLAFSPDGTRLAAAGRDRAVKIWDTVPPMLRAAEPALPLVDQLYHELGRPRSVAKRLRENGTLSEDLRRAAEIGVLWRASEYTAQARDLLERLFADFQEPSDVIALLRGDASISSPVRQIAIDIAQARLRGDATLDEQ